MTARLSLSRFVFPRSPWRPSTAFRFRIPDGFRDLSPGLPDASFRRSSGCDRDRGRKRQVRRFRHGPPGGGRLLRELQRGGTVGSPQSERRLRERAQGDAPRRVFEASRRTQVVIIEHGLASLAGVPVVRAVYDVQNPESPDAPDAVHDPRRQRPVGHPHLHGDAVRRSTAIARSSRLPRRRPKAGRRRSSWTSDARECGASTAPESGRSWASSRSSRRSARRRRSPCRAGSRRPDPTVARR